MAQLRPIWSHWPQLKNVEQNFKNYLSAFHECILISATFLFITNLIKLFFVVIGGATTLGTTAFCITINKSRILGKMTLGILTFRTTINKT